MKIALKRDPGAAAPAAPGGLLVRNDPHAARIACQRAAARLLVGRVDGVELNDAPRGERVVQALSGGQKSDCAAAIAASVIGDGRNTNRMMASAETASTMRVTGSARSNALAGSSKYISFTILR